MKIVRIFISSVCFAWVHFLFSSAPSGLVKIPVSAGTPESPSYSIVSPGIKRSLLYQGFTLSSSDNNITFEQIPDQANPAILKGPFTTGVLGSRSARAEAALDVNGSVDFIRLLDAGEGYQGNPLVSINPPADGNGSSEEFSTAYALSETNSSTLRVESVSVVTPGSGYVQAPVVNIDGGPYFVRVIEEDSNFSGIFFEIISNSDHSLELNNSANYDLSSVFPDGTEIEIFRGWTIGSLLGFEETELVSDQNASLADWVFIIKQSSDQEGNSSDYIPYFHNGSNWTQVDSPAEDSSNLVIYPDEAVILSARNDQNYSLSVMGTASVVPSYWELPELGKRRLLCNPHSSSIKLSDLIPCHAITEDNSSNHAHLFLAHPDQDKADNIQIINSAVWSTFWHDGTNLDVSRPARISVRPGSGIGGALTTQDFSMASGSIESISNPSNGNAVITSSGHGLLNGFHVTISSAIGRLTNENKDQINQASEVVSDGQGLIVESSVNGIWEIINSTTDTFELKDCYANSDFLDNNQATWSTGDRGEGYDSNVSLTILGGGGTGAKAFGIVQNGQIASISLQQGGYFYHQVPEIMVHPGGWRMIGKGKSPLNDLTVPAGSGVLIIRKHPSGVASRIPLSALK